mgnify:CR=1 FL=1
MMSQILFAKFPWYQTKISLFYKTNSKSINSVLVVIADPGTGMVMKEKNAKKKKKIKKKKI